MVMAHLLHILYEVLLFLAFTRHAEWKLCRQDRHSVALDIETFFLHSGQVTSLFLLLAVFGPPSLLLYVITIVAESNKSCPGDFAAGAVEMLKSNIYYSIA